LEQGYFITGPLWFMNVYKLMMSKSCLQRWQVYKLCRLCLTFLII